MHYCAFQVGSKDSLAATTSTAVGDFDVREDLVLRSHTVGSSSLPGTAARISTPNRVLPLDIGLASGPGRGDELTASRYEDFNNNDDDEEPRSDEFQTYSLRSSWNEDLESPTIPFLEGRHDVKFIDDEDDYESDGVDQKELDRRTTTNITASDEDMAASSTAGDLGRRWGTVDLIPKPTAISLLPSLNSLPLKSIMKSPTSVSENTLSKTKKGITFSQDTVFK